MFSSRMPNVLTRDEWRGSYVIVTLVLKSLYLFFSFNFFLGSSFIYLCFAWKLVFFRPFFQYFISLLQMEISFLRLFGNGGQKSTSGFWWRLRYITVEESKHIAFCYHKYLQLRTLICEYFLTWIVLSSSLVCNTFINRYFEYSMIIINIILKNNNHSFIKKIFNFYFLFFNIFKFFI